MPSSDAFPPAFLADRHVVRTRSVQAFASRLRGMDSDVSDAERIDQIRALEELKAAACAAQARISVDFDRSQREDQEARGLKPSETGVGIAAQVALARRESPHLGNRLIGLAKALVEEMPHTLAALESGHLNEWRATLLVKGTACLAREDRQQVDATMCSDPQRVSRLGDRRLEAEVKTEAYACDPHSVVDRAARAEADRRVSLRPAPDTMTWLTALLPVCQGVAAYAALTKEAASARASGDERSRGQLMADTLVERLTGQTEASAVPVQVNLVMTDGALLDKGTQPAHVLGYGPIPSGQARKMIKQAPEAARWVRRLYKKPGSGQLIAMDSRSRFFPDALADFLALRDQTCRRPWCDAPIRNSDHVIDQALGGPTSAANGQGLCEACNHVKQAPGWRARTESATPDSVHRVTATTPTGHEYVSDAPDPPGSDEDRAARRHGFTPHPRQPGVWIAPPSGEGAA